MHVRKKLYRIFQPFIEKSYKIKFFNISPLNFVPEGPRTTQLVSMVSDMA